MIGRTARLSDEVLVAAHRQSIDDALARRPLNTVLLLVGDLIRVGSATPADFRRYFLAWQVLQMQRAPSERYRLAGPLPAPPEPVG